MAGSSRAWRRPADECGMSIRTKSCGRDASPLAKMAAECGSAALLLLWLFFSSLLLLRLLLRVCVPVCLCPCEREGCSKKVNSGRAARHTGGEQLCQSTAPNERAVAS
eukprot:11120312-Alexandrium_andersonii.AAC.1